MNILEGTIVSQKTKNTALVEVITRTPHPKYRKLIKSSKKFKIEVKDGEVSVGDKVEIVETRKMSKDKFFKLHKVTKKKEEAK